MTPEPPEHHRKRESRREAARRLAERRERALRGERGQASASDEDALEAARSGGSLGDEGLTDEGLAEGAAHTHHFSHGQDASGRRRRRVPRWLKIVLLSALVVFVALGAFALIKLDQLSRGLPDIGNVNAVSSFETTRIFDSKRRQIVSLASEGNRVVIPESKIPKVMRNAVVAVEDKRFYSHPAVDIWGIVRAVWTDFVRHSVVQGGSTITQQYVKIAYFSQQRTLTRKIREVLLAYRLEKKYSKDQILDKYLNTIYFGEGAYGLEAASETFFGVHAQSLSLPQAALLAGVIRSPAHYNPFNHPQSARERRALVLSLMADQGYITKEEAAAAATSPLPKAKKVMLRSGIAPHFIDYVTQRLVALVGEHAAYTGGLKVYTTLDLDLQKAAVKAIADALPDKKDPSASLVALDPKTGNVLAMVGGRDYATQQYNVATQGHRQAGSSFKTFVLAAAVSSGISPDQYFNSDSPQSFDITGGPVWKVSNYEGSGNGYIPLTDATAHSVNCAYANLMMDVGPKKVVATAKAMGITTPLNADPAIALGGLREGVNTMEMASAYGALADQGTAVTPHAIAKIVQADGTAVPLSRPKKRKALDPGVAYLVTKTLQGVIAFGTGVNADIGRPEAGKTGTTQNYADAWFVGYVPQMSTAVWVGYPEAKVPMRDVHGIKVTGGSFPAKIWAAFMRRALDGKPAPDFKEPAGAIVTRKIDPITGYLASPFCPTVVDAEYVKGLAPTEVCPVHTNMVMPKLVGLTQTAALALLKPLGIEASVTVVGSSAPKGQVVGQSPAAGSKAKRGLVAKIDVSDGKGAPSATTTTVGPPVTVPSVVGLSLAEAKTQLSAAGFHYTVTYQSSTKPSGTVLSTDPTGGSRAPKGSTIKVFASGAQQVVSVPDVAGMTAGAAQAALSAAGFSPVAQDANATESQGKKHGTVVRQSPAAGSLAPKGSTVVIYVAIKT
jgi:penicillin-binding protein 1A